MTSYDFIKIYCSEYFIHDIPKCLYLVVIDANKDRSILPKKLPEQCEPWIHHAKPAIMPIQCLAFPAYDLAKPIPDNRAIHVVVINPVFVARIVGRIDIDALHLSGIVGQQRLERDEVIALDNKIAVARLAAGKTRHVLKQVKRHLKVMVDYSFFSDPV